MPHMPRLSNQVSYGQNQQTHLISKYAIIDLGQVLV